ncbi:MAG: PmoA family protein [Verrucomicrobiales bacterium]|nr:PmoA family protein [Verrucomicrobiales bacterium]
MTKRISLVFLGSFYFLLSATIIQGETSSMMKIEEGEHRILIKRGDRTVFVYNKAPTEEAAQHEPFFSRTGYIHPVYSPSGKEVTGDFAADHKHQHGLFFAWTKTRVGEQKAEFWNQKLKMGEVRYHRTLNAVGGRERCELVVEHLWDAKDKAGKLTPAIKETWKVTARDFGDDLFLFDIESVQWQRTDVPIKIEKHHYGGMAIRGNDQWLLENGETNPSIVLQTDEGLERIEGNHTRPRWVTMAGPIDGERAGVTVMGHPSNFRSPQWVRLHPTKPYFVWAPMVEEPFQIEGGKPYVSRYRYVVSDGKVSAEKLEEIYTDWTKVE